MSNLERKVALITGGSRGIGAGIAKRFASEGATVVITYANSARWSRGWRATRRVT